MILKTNHETAGIMMTIFPPLFRALLVLLLLSASATLTGCGDDATSTTTAQTTTAKPDATAQERTRVLTELFSQRPPSVQRRNKPLTIGFRQAVISDDKIGSDATAYLKFSPSVAGKAQFDTASSIVFVPDAALASGQNYTVTVKPAGLLNIPADTQPVEFSFKTAPMELDIQIQGLDPVADQPNQMQLEGKVFTADYVEAAAVEKILQASTQQKPLSIGWEHNDNGTEHRFVVVNVPRETFGTDLHLSWDGKSLNAQNTDSNGSRDFKIPSQQTFSITRIDTLHANAEGKPHVSISFSDALDPQQDLKGLVQLGSGEVTTQIVGSSLLVYPAGEL